MKLQSTLAILSSLATAFSTSSAQIVETLRISNTLNGDAGDFATSSSSISADGNVIVFYSDADDLVSNDSNGIGDVFVLDRTIGVIERVSVTSDGSELHGYWSRSPSITSDGHYAAFMHEELEWFADWAGGTWFWSDRVYIRDRVAGTTTVATQMCPYWGIGGAAISGDGSTFAYHSDWHEYDAYTGYSGPFQIWLGWDSMVTSGNRDSLNPHLSHDGATIAFQSYATDFPQAGNPGFISGAYVLDVASGVLERIDVDTTGTKYGTMSYATGISDDGSIVSFQTIDALVADDMNSTWDIYLRDRNAGTTERVSIASDGHEASLGAVGGSMAGDGHLVVFNSASPDLVDNDTNGVQDVFFRDRALGVTTRVSIGTHAEEGTADSSSTSLRALSDDGTYVVFDSAADDFAANDANSASDVFLRGGYLIDASWTNYGDGYPGRDGAIPTMTSSGDPLRGASIDIDISNSARSYIVGFLFVGLTRDSIATSLGGTLLLDPLVTQALPFIPSGLTIAADIPAAYWANGLVIDVQTLELDPWASKGVSFTDGLELVIGDG